MGSGPRCGLVGTGLGRLSFYYRSLLWVGLQVLARCHLHRHWGGSRRLSAPHPNQRHARLCCSPEEATLQAPVSVLQGALWQPLWPTCSLRPIWALRQGPKVSTLGRASPRYPPSSQQKIKRGKFIEMAELLPEFWSSTREDDHSKQEASPGEPARCRTFLPGCNAAACT